MRIHNSKKAQRTLVYSAILSEELAKIWGALVDDGIRRHILEDAHMTMLRKMQEAQAAGDFETSGQAIRQLGVTAKRLILMDRNAEIVDKPS